MAGKRNKTVSEDVKKQIFGMIAKNYKQAEIARILDLSKSAVSQIIKRINAENSFIPRKPTGRPRITTNKDDKFISKKAIVNPRLTAVDIFKDLSQNSAIKCSVSTVKRRLREQGLFGRHGVKKPLISKKNKIARIQWARDHQSWSLTDWSKVIYSDECKFDLFGSYCIKWIRRPKGQRNNIQYQIPTVKHGGGSVMVWGCFTASGVGPIVRITGRMDSHIYTKILEDNLLPFAKDQMPADYIFQQDNDPKHKSCFTKTWFELNNVHVMPWPSQSPDCNPIEHIWDELKRRIKSKKCTNANQLFDLIKHEWQNIDHETIMKLIKSMNSRCNEVIASKGFATRY